MLGTLQGLSVIKSPQVLVQKGKHCIAFETTHQFASLSTLTAEELATFSKTPSVIPTMQIKRHSREKIKIS